MNTREKAIKKEDHNQENSQGQDQESKEKLVFLGGLPLTLTRSELLSYLEQFGLVEKLILPFNPETGLLKGHGKAIFTSKQGRDNVLFQKNHTLNGVNFGITPWIEPAHYFLVKNQESRRKLFVKHKSKHKEADLVNYFEQFGQVVRFDMRKNHNTNKTRNFAFVYFSDEAAVAKVLALESHMVQDLPLECRPCEPSLKEIEQQVTAINHIRAKNPQALALLEESLSTLSQNMKPSNHEIQTKSKIKKSIHDKPVKNRRSNPIGNSFRNKASKDDPPRLSSFNKKGMTKKAPLSLDPNPNDDSIKPTSALYSASKRELIASSHLKESQVLFRLATPKAVLRSFSLYTQF